MDSVIGRVGGKVLLTLMFTYCDFMLVFVKERNASQSVIDTFDIWFSDVSSMPTSRTCPAWMRQRRLSKRAHRYRRLFGVP